jgi:hypothetical protein
MTKKISPFENLILLVHIILFQIVFPGMYLRSNIPAITGEELRPTV